ncbi:MAG: hypothetical protein HQL70_08755 [Magnetococcales bacterium]|nr:hypothetical protein [Magnetococcales bacterium]
MIFSIGRNHAKVKWHELLKFLEESEVNRVLLAGPTPQWRNDLPFLYAAQINHPLVTPDIDLDLRFITDDKFMQEISTTGYSIEVHKVPIRETICSSFSSCQYRVPEKLPGDFLLVWDYSHLSFSGSIYVASQAFSKYYKEL